MCGFLKLRALSHSGYGKTSHLPAGSSLNFFTISWKGNYGYESSESANNLLSYVASASTNHTSARRTLELWTCDNDGEG
jgi:hypothetical protein